MLVDWRHTHFTLIGHPDLLSQRCCHPVVIQSMNSTTRYSAKVLKIIPSCICIEFQQPLPQHYTCWLGAAPRRHTPWAICLSHSMSIQQTANQTSHQAAKAKHFLSCVQAKYHTWSQSCVRWPTRCQTNHMFGSWKSIASMPMLCKTSVQNPSWTSCCTYSKATQLPALNQSQPMPL